MKIRELLSDASKWCSINYAKNKEGQDTDVRSADAVCWCLEGAIRHCYEIYEYAVVSQKLTKASYKLFPKRSIALSVFNDDPLTTFEDIQQLVTFADV